jgi:hypothetical protein
MFCAAKSGRKARSSKRDTALVHLANRFIMRANIAAWVRFPA